MTAPEVRAVAIFYFRTRETLSRLEQPLQPELLTPLTDLLHSIEQSCATLTEGSAPAKWAKEMVGPVLAAAVGAAAWMRRDVPSALAAQRIFGLAGSQALSSNAAWKLVRPYLHEPLLSERTLADLAVKTGLELKPKDNSPVEVIIELTRPRSAGFATDVGRWIKEYFRENGDAITPYGVLYRRVVEEMATQNEQTYSATSTVHGEVTREDWQVLVNGKVPRKWVEHRAAYSVTRQFIADYWDKWQVKKSAVI